MKKPKDRRSLPPPALLVLGFLIAIILGTALLQLPGATETGSISFVDALFTATSAACVTGLIVVDTGSYFTPFGQTVILVLIQMGGLGIMTVSTFFLLLMGRRIRMRDQIALRDTSGPDRVFRMGRLVVMVILTTVLFETLGWAILFSCFRASGMEGGAASYSAAFHSISAFCNAGFSIYSDSLMSYLDHPGVVAVVMLLFFVGGLGFVVIMNLTEQRPWRKDRTRRGRLSTQTKVVWVFSLVLTAAGAILFAVLEWNNTLGGLALRERLMGALFHSLTPRTAGFNVLPMERMIPATLFMTIILMFIGASPGSTGGGVKTCTFAVLLAVCRSFLTGSEQTLLFGKSISQDAIRQSITIIVISLSLVFVLTLALLTSEVGREATVGGVIVPMTLERILFETFSAFGTVGLSTGITGDLSTVGKLIITITMFIGRTSPLTLALLVSKEDPASQAIRYPEESIMVG